MTIQEIEDILPDLCRDINRHTNDINSSTWSIFYDNKIVCTRSGKFGWNTLGDAKRAFHMSFGTYYNRLDKKGVLEFLIKEGIIEFKEMK